MVLRNLYDKMIEDRIGMRMQWMDICADASNGGPSIFPTGEKGMFMKTVIHAFVISIIVHVVYLASTIGIGYWKTKLYKPDVENAWEKAAMLQNEVVFGHTGSPILYLVSFVGVAAVVALVMHVYQMVRG